MSRTDRCGTQAVQGEPRIMASFFEPLTDLIHRGIELSLVQIRLFCGRPKEDETSDGESLASEKFRSNKESWIGSCSDCRRLVRTPSSRIGLPFHRALNS